MNTNRQKKIAVINDLSGYGRCSLTVAIPIISAMGVQCCPVPTSILSNHTGFSTYFFDDYTENMKHYLDAWKKLELKFDGIYTGFLGSQKQIMIVTEAIKNFRNKDTVIIIDPIMGDHGKTYKTYTGEMCDKMKNLVSFGDIVTPNLTESCILTQTEYKDSGFKHCELEKMASKIHELGPQIVIITGIREKSYICNLISIRNGDISYQRCKKTGTERPGTGDVFSSIIAANAVLDTPVRQSVKQAALFVKNCIRESELLSIPIENGVCFEKLLYLLYRKKVV